jgi:hypothetical protein
MSPRRALLWKRWACRRVPSEPAGIAAACLFKRDRTAATSTDHRRHDDGGPARVERGGTPTSEPCLRGAEKPLGS